MSSGTCTPTACTINGVATSVHQRTPSKESSKDGNDVIVTENFMIDELYLRVEKLNGVWAMCTARAHMSCRSLQTADHYARTIGD
jgi:hypothetical protein